MHSPGLQPEGDGPGPQGGDGDVLPHRVPVLHDAGAQRLGDGVGDVEDGGVVAPGGRQLQDGGGVGRWYPGGEAGGATGVEALVEGVQGSGARPAPSVDGLVGVADGGHPGVGEEGGQEADLGDRGVLELVEQDGGVLRPHLGDRLGNGLGDGAGQGDLVPEVEEAVAALVVVQLGDDVEQSLPLAHDGRRLADQGLAALDGGQGGKLLAQVGQVLGGLVNGQQVLAQGIAQDQDGTRVVDEALVGKREGAGLEQGGDDLPRAGLGDEGGVGVDADAQAVVAHQGAGEGVVGGDHRLTDIGGIGSIGASPVSLRRGDREQAGGAEADQAGGDALVQLGSGLSGEGQSEDLVGADLPGGDQVDDPLGHGGGLARAGSGDDQERAESVSDDARLLLGGGVDTQRLRQGLRGELASSGGGHETTLLPSTWTGQESLTMQVRQCSPVRAWSRGPEPATAAPATRSSAQ